MTTHWLRNLPEVGAPIIRQAKALEDLQHAYIEASLEVERLRKSLADAELRAFAAAREQWALHEIEQAKSK